MLWHIVFYFLFIVAIFETIALLYIYIGKKKTGVQYRQVPTWLFPKIEEVLELTDESIVYDLGCGETKVLRYLLHKNPYAQGIGIEITPLPYFYAKILNAFSPIGRLTIVKKDFFTVPVKDATHVFIYLLPIMLDRLLPKLESELKPGTRLVSCDFKFTKKEASEKINVPGKKYSHTLYIYEF